MNSDNFFSVERLIEFGLGVGIAQQMVKSMNNALQSTYMPTAQATPLTGISPPVVSVSFFIVLDGHQAGPFNESELSRLVMEGRVTKTTYIWRAGMPRWEFAERVPDFLRIIALAPPPIPTTSADPAQQTTG